MIGGIGQKTGWECLCASCMASFAAADVFSELDNTDLVGFKII